MSVAGATPLDRQLTREELAVDPVEPVPAVPPAASTTSRFGGAGGHVLSAFVRAFRTPDLRRIIPDAPSLKGVACYLCGPMAMVASATALLRERGVAPDHIYFEQFDFR